MPENNVPTKSIGRNWKRMAAIIGVLVFAGLAFILVMNIHNERMAANHTDVHLVSAGWTDTSVLGDFRATLYACLRNDGGSGNAIIEFNYSEGKVSWTKSGQYHFNANETKKVSMEFSEAHLLRKAKYSVVVK